MYIGKNTYISTYRKQTRGKWPCGGALADLPEDDDDPGKEIDVEENGEEDGQGQEPVTVASFHPTLGVLKKLEVL